jgi:hypothetical protein
MATELRMAMDMAAQLNQIREQVLQLMLQSQPVGTGGLNRKNAQLIDRLIELS